jgi:hypothetical protein
VDEEGSRRDLVGYVMWFNAAESVLIDEPNYYEENRGDRHVYLLADGRRRHKPRYPAYRIHEESMPQLRMLREASHEIVDISALYRRLISVILAMTRYVSFRKSEDS